MESERKMKSFSFTVEEQLRLLDLIANEKNIIENKTTNKLTNDEKDQAWQRVTTAFNAVAVHRRNMDQLKSKYDNLKTKTRKVVAAQRSYTRGTGGGAPQSDNFDPVIESVLKIINIKTVLGFHNSFDCDNDVGTRNEEEILSKNAHVIPVDKQISDLPIIILGNEPSGSHTSDGISSQDNNEEIVLHLHFPLESTNLESPNLESASEETVPASIKKTKRKWSSYTPNKLKEPVSRQLRPTIPNSAIIAKEKFYNKKIALLEKRIWAMEEENRRQEESHAKKQILLDLQIAEIRNKNT